MSEKISLDSSVIFSKKLVQCGYYFVIFTVDIHVAEI